MAVEAIFKQYIDKAYHTTGTVAIMGKGFGQLASYDILQQLRLN